MGCSQSYTVLLEVPIAKGVGESNMSLKAKKANLLVALQKKSGAD